MKSISRLFVAILVVLAGLALSSCGKQAASSNSDKTAPVNIRIEILKPSRFVDRIEVAGTAKASDDALLSPEEGGVIKEWKAKKGDTVKKGDLIVVLKDEVMKAGYDAADAQYKMAELNVQKQRKVFDEQGISELQIKNFEYTRDAAKANADLMKARWERTQIRSPFDGTVDNTIPNVGDFAPPGVPLARVVNTSTLKIQADMPEMYAGSVHVGSPVFISFDALPGDTLKGRVNFVGSTVSAANRALQVEIVLTNPFRKIKADMIAKVRILRETKTNALLVSENLLQLVDRDRTIVYVENNGKAEERRLKLGGRQGIMVDVIEGLNAGDHLIVSGYQKVVNGTPVIVTQ
jgi:membrane fusion protein (multidrug efflux system)